MGTRNLTMVINKEGETKIAQYGQWDGYPEGQGVTILNFLKSADLEQLNKKLKNCTWVTQEQFDQFYKDAGHDGGQWVNMEVSDRMKSAHPQLNRDMAAEVLEHVYNSEKDVLLQNSEAAGKKGSWVEWSYIINLKENTLSVHGHIDEPAIKVYKLDALPEEKRFISDFEENDEEDKM